MMYKLFLILSWICFAGFQVFSFDSYAATPSAPLGEAGSSSEEFQSGEETESSAVEESGEGDEAPAPKTKSRGGSSATEDKGSKAQNVFEASGIIPKSHYRNLEVDPD